MYHFAKKKKNPTILMLFEVFCPVATKSVKYIKNFKFKYIVPQVITIMVVLCHWTSSGTLKNLGDVDKRSSPSKVKRTGQNMIVPVCP